MSPYSLVSYYDAASAQRDTYFKWKQAERRASYLLNQNDFLRQQLAESRVTIDQLRCTVNNPIEVPSILEKLIKAASELYSVASVTITSNIGYMVVDVNQNGTVRSQARNLDLNDAIKAAAKNWLRQVGSRARLMELKECLDG